LNGGFRTRPESPHGDCSADSEPPKVLDARSGRKSCAPARKVGLRCLRSSADRCHDAKANLVSAQAAQFGHHLARGRGRRGPALLDRGTVETIDGQSIQGRGALDPRCTAIRRSVKLARTVRRVGSKQAGGEIVPATCYLPEGCNIYRLTVQGVCFRSFLSGGALGGRYERWVRSASVATVAPARRTTKASTTTGWRSTGT